MGLFYIFATVTYKKKKKPHGNKREKKACGFKHNLARNLFVQGEARGVAVKLSTWVHVTISHLQDE